MKFRKKPVVIEAARWPGREGTEFDDFLTTEDHRAVSIDYAAVEDFEAAPLLVETLEGVMKADPDDWIIRGVRGELYPCKPDIFAATYEPVEVSS